MLTGKQQMLLIEIYKNRSQITKLEQSVYSSHAFYDKVSELKRMRLVGSKFDNKNNGSGFKPCIYYLTNRGYALVRILIGERWL